MDPRMALKARGKIIFIRLGDVVAVKAAGNYVSVEQATSPHRLRESISAVAQELEPYGFILIHRSVLVNTLHVEEIWPQPTGEYCLRVKDGREYTVSRMYKKNLKALAELWIGPSASFQQPQTYLQNHLKAFS